MRIQPVQGTNIYFNNTNPPKIKKQKVSPAKDCLKTAAIWFGFGLGFDYLTRKCVIYKKSPTKNSFAVNGIVALIAASVTFFKDVFSNK